MPTASPDARQTVKFIARLWNARASAAATVKQFARAREWPFTRSA